MPPAIPAPRRRAPAPRLLLLAAALGAATWAVAWLAACGSSAPPPPPTSPPASASPAATASPSPQAGSRPLAGTPRQAAAEYWRLVNADDFAATQAASVPGTPSDMTAVTDDIAHVRLVSARAPRPAGAGSVQIEVTVYVRPTAGATPWGPAGEHTLFMYLQKAPAGGWLVKGWGTGP